MISMFFYEETFNLLFLGIAERLLLLLLLHMGIYRLVFFFLGSHFGKTNLERLFRMLVIRGVLKEVPQQNSQGFIVSYITVRHRFPFVCIFFKFIDGVLLPSRWVLNLML
jgi:hypothetical protein